MFSIVLFVLLSTVPTASEALQAMLSDNPFPTEQQAVLVEYGDSFVLPESTDLAKYAILRQFHRMAFQVEAEQIDLLAEYIAANWEALDTETRNLWREFAGRTGLEVPVDVVTAENLTSILRYCAESGAEAPAVNISELTTLQRLHYVNTLSGEEVNSFITDPNWAVRNAVMQKSGTAAFEMYQDPSLYLRMTAAQATGRSDLLMELASTPGPIGSMALSGVGQLPILEDSLFRSKIPAIRVSSLLALLELGWTVPVDRIDYLFTDEYPMIGTITADATGRDFEMPPDDNFPYNLPSLQSVPDQILIVTDAGEFQVTLLKDIAPVTCRSFWYLAESGFYDDIYFHRVIPGFVAQAGCPEGNGYGGPGYTIPAENNTFAYDRGVIGMADSGMNTGGSQFFIMLDSQRRLDCRYTVFADIEDAHLIDDIEVGTKILGISLVD